MTLGRFLGRQPWVDRVVARIRAGATGQPLLFAGPEGSGKEATALEIARRVTCRTPDVCERAAVCESCVKAISYQHPDIRWIGPAPASIDDHAIRELFASKRKNPFHVASYAGSANIAIGAPDQPGPLTVRALIRFLRLQAFQSRLKVAVVADAHRLTAAAANALLKTLEEPPPQTLIMLVSANPSALLPTVQSRCQRLPFDSYGAEELADILVDVAGLEREPALRLARWSDGNARRAVALLSPASRALDVWARRLVRAIHDGRRHEAHLAAAQLHGGTLPADLVADGGETPDARALATGDPGVKRERALQLCEMLNLYYSEALACRELGPDRRAHLVEDDGLDAIAARRRSRSLVADLLRVESAKRDIDRNSNIGLAMAVLFEDLIDHAERDRQASGT